MPGHCNFTLIPFDATFTLPLEIQDEEISCFRDIKPGAPHHYLVVPTRHVGNCKSLGKEHVSLGKYAALLFGLVFTKLFGRCPKCVAAPEMMSMAK